VVAMSRKIGQGPVVKKGEDWDATGNPSRVRTNGGFRKKGSKWPKESQVSP